MLWPWRRRQPAPVAPAGPDEVTGRLRELAADWQADPGVPAWDDHTRLLPIVTPAARARGWGRR